MTIDEMRKRARELQSIVDRRRGVKEELERTLEENHGCKDLKSARSKLKKLETEYAESLSSFNELKKKYEAMFSE